MSTSLVTIRPEEPITIVRALFEKNSFHHLPVCDSEGTAVGIISREDFYKVLYLLSGGDEPAMRVALVSAADIMTKNPLCLDPDDSIGLAADIFLANKFHALPIVEEGTLVGLLTSHDLLAYSFNSPVEDDTRLSAYSE